MGVNEFLNWLISIASTLPNKEGEDASDSFLQSVKLIHIDDLKKWGSFKEYSEHNSITFAEYQDGAKRIKALKSQVQETAKIIKRLEELEKGNYEEYDIIEIPVPRSLLRNEIEIPLPDSPYENMKMFCQDGEIRDNKLYIRGTWKKQIATVIRSCPSSILHKNEIASIQEILKETPKETLDKLDEIKSSRFSQPVLFISHRWESSSYPDPEGTQYQKLSKLENCFIIYDYSSFPQKITSEDLKEALEKILVHMNKLIKNVVILKSPNYMERGWCIYEYTLASLGLSLVCDEVQDPDFISLRNFRATRPTPSQTLKGHSVDSAIQNGISEGILKAVNRILPKYKSSLFSVEKDREKVTDLLLDWLAEVLPQKKEYPSPYLGEWIDVPWTPESLRNAFRDEIPLSGIYNPYNIKPYSLRVPSTLEEAVANGYALDIAPLSTPLTFLERIDWSGMFPTVRFAPALVFVLSIFIGVFSLYEFVRDFLTRWLSPRRRK